MPRPAHYTFDALVLPWAEYIQGICLQESRTLCSLDAYGVVQRDRERERQQLLQRPFDASQKLTLTRLDFHTPHTPEARDRDSSARAPAARVSATRAMFAILAIISEGRTERKKIV